MTVDEYLNRFSGDVRQRLEKLRQEIRGIAPDAEEGMSYGVPAFKYRGKNVILYAGFAKHIGVYPEPATIQAFKDDLIEYETSKGTVKIYHNQEVPYDLIKNMVEFRMGEIRRR